MYRILHRTKDKAVDEHHDLDAVPSLVGAADTLTWIDFCEVGEPNGPDGEPPKQNSGVAGIATPLQGKLENLLRTGFQFHPLAIEDVLSESSTPRVDDWDGYLYIVLHAVQWDTALQDVDTAELDIFLGPNYLITYRSEAIPAVDRLWRSAQRDERHSRRGADFLLYEIADAVASDYLPCMDAMDEEIDRIEDHVFEKPNPQTAARIFKLKSAALNLRRVLSPQREVMSKLAREDYGVIDPRDRVYFRDVYDHFVRLVDLNESLRDLVTGALDTYLSVTANRTNDVMKTMTIFTVLFSPLAVITSFFGMNFFAESIVVQSPFDPRLLFWFVILVMIAVPTGLLMYIRRRGWW
jgi:magnesium transporter